MQLKTPEGFTVILCRPQLAENIGAVARAMGNCGLNDLRLVAPRDGWPNPQAWPLAAGADWILDQAVYYQDCDQAVADLHQVYATTARQRHVIKNWLTPKAAAQQLHTEILQGNRCGILFGPERAGLNNEEIALANDIISVPLNPDFSSLNLAQSVLIVAYEWFQETTENIQPQKLVLNETVPANQEQIRQFINFLETRLLDRGFLSDADRRPITLRNIQGFLKRADVTEQDIKTLYGIMRALERPLNNS